MVKHLFLWTLVFGSLAAAPVMLIWGWVRWLSRADERTDSAKSSFFGFLLATASGVLAASTIAYMLSIGGFRPYNSLLPWVCLSGLFLSLVGTMASLSGISKPNLLRWHAVLSAVGTLMFWLIALASD